MSDEPTTKTRRQRDRILSLLLAAGPVGCSNALLNEVGFRYGARICELRREWDIVTVRKSETEYCLCAARQAATAAAKFAGSSVMGLEGMS